MTELSLDEEARRGDIVRKILETAEFQDAIEMVRRGFHEEWERATTTPAREECHASIRGLNKLLDRLRGIADSGEHARFTRAREARATE